MSHPAPELYQPHEYRDHALLMYLRRQVADIEGGMGRRLEWDEKRLPALKQMVEYQLALPERPEDKAV